MKGSVDLEAGATILGSQEAEKEAEEVDPQTEKNGVDL